MFGRRMSYEPEPKQQIPFAQLDYENVITMNLNYTIYTDDEIAKIKSAANRRNYKDGKYINSKNGLGPDNPIVVGMPDCSSTLVYDRTKDRWILTDGLGNGWIR